MPQISLVMQASNPDRPHTAKAALADGYSTGQGERVGMRRQAAIGSAEPIDDNARYWFVLSQHHAPGGPKTCCPKTLFRRS
jgi:hypothetical protein